MFWDGWHPIFWIGGVFQLLFWGALIYGIVVLVRRHPRAPGASTGALSLLEERYARGEIDRDEFLERRRVLLGGPGEG